MQTYPKPTLTAADMARSELNWLLPDCRGELELDDRGYLNYYSNKHGDRMYFDPMWNSFEHPVHDWSPVDAAERSASALTIITTVLRLLWP